MVKRFHSALASKMQAKQFVSLAILAAAAALTASSAAWAASKPAAAQPQYAGYDKPYSEADVPAGPLGDSIKHGYFIVTQTKKALPNNVGNAMYCTACHQDNGQKPFAAPFVGLPAIFPQFNKRDGKIITLQDRINGCFKRSMNGKALDTAGQDMTDIVAYMNFLSRGVPLGTELNGRGFVVVSKPAQPEDAARGKLVYEAKCSMCHAADGQGMKAGDNYIFPTLWGANSYNDGAGMAQVDKAVRFIKHNMPKNAPDSLTEQEAWDVAKYIDSQPRPHFEKEKQQ